MNQMRKKGNRKIILEDGREFYGDGFGSLEDKVCEIVFNTSMTGYQEILSDPSYTDQAVVMTYPLIGNYGMAADDYETRMPSVSAMIVRHYNEEPSNFRSEQSLGQVMEACGIAGISGVDTRELTRSIRDFGTRKALITDADTPAPWGLALLRDHPLPTDAVSRVSCREKQFYYHAEDIAGEGDFLRQKNSRHIVAVDCGMKRNIVRSLLRRGCEVTVVPWNTTAEEIRALRPDGILISNGPGNPEDVPETIETVRTLLGTVPVFGICLGHQILSLAYGAKTYKLKFGHRGGNHSVRDLETGRIEITSQNHSYAVREESLGDTPLRATHINLLDRTIEGVSCPGDRAFGVQYHPESAPGPRDNGYLFDRFLALL